MPHVFTPHAMEDGKFGPTGRGHYYTPMSYHGKKARKRADKTRWVLTQSEEYEVFQLNDDYDPQMFLADVGLYGVLEKGEEILGENDECLSYFPIPQNANDSWHGYPIHSTEHADVLNDAIFDSWFRQGLVSEIAYQRLLHEKI